MTIDGMWTVAGSTNFDHRSFALNDEVNLAMLTARLHEPLHRQVIVLIKYTNRNNLNAAGL